MPTYGIGVETAVVDFKACPRCRGAVHVTEDIYGVYRECLHCGYMLDIEKTPRKYGDGLTAKRRVRRSHEAA